MRVSFVWIVGCCGVFPLALAAGCPGGCLGAPVDVSGDDVIVNDDSNGAKETNIDRVNVDDANVDADTNVDARADANVTVNVDLGGAGGDGGDQGDDDGGTTAIGDDGASFVMRYHGPIDDHADLVPSFSAAVAVSSVEWRIRDVVFDTPAFFEDAASFDWGAPDGDDGSWLLAARFDDHADDDVRWDTSTAVCIGGACAPRSIAAACSGTVEMRAWLVDGTELVVTAAHASARPTCL